MVCFQRSLAFTTGGVGVLYAFEDLLDIRDLSATEGHAAFFVSTADCRSCSLLSPLRASFSSCSSPTATGGFSKFCTSFAPSYSIRRWAEAGQATELFSSVTGVLCPTQQGAQKFAYPCLIRDGTPLGADLHEYAVTPHGIFSLQRPGTHTWTIGRVAISCQSLLDF